MNWKFWKKEGGPYRSSAKTHQNIEEALREKVIVSFEALEKAREAVFNQAIQSAEQDGFVGDLIPVVRKWRAAETVHEALVEAVENIND